MGLSSRDDLNIVELVFYVPALGLFIWVLLKQGFGRQLGWLYLAILSLVVSLAHQLVWQLSAIVQMAWSKPLSSVMVLVSHG